MTLVGFFRKTMREDSSFEDPNHSSFYPAQKEEPMKSSETQKRVFSLAVLAIVLSTGALIMAGLKRPLPLVSQVVMVDVNQLLRLKATALLSEKGFDPHDDKNSLRLAEQARVIRSLIEKYAADRGVIVVAKGAVFGKDIVDVTDDLSSLL